MIKFLWFIGFTHNVEKTFPNKDKNNIHVLKLVGKSFHDLLKICENHKSFVFCSTQTANQGKQNQHTNLIKYKTALSER